MYSWVINWYIFASYDFRHLPSSHLNCQTGLRVLFCKMEYFVFVDFMESNSAEGIKTTLITIITESAVCFMLKPTVWILIFKIYDKLNTSPFLFWQENFWVCLNQYDIIAKAETTQSFTAPCYITYRQFILDHI